LGVSRRDIAGCAQQSRRGGKKGIRCTRANIGQFLDKLRQADVKVAAAPAAATGGN